LFIKPTSKFSTPVAKNVKSVDKKRNYLPKRDPTTRKKTFKAVAPAQKKTSVEIEAANDSDDTRKNNDGTNIPEPPFVGSSDEATAVSSK
jgi:hypothetical protein